MIECFGVGESHTESWVSFKPFFETGKCQYSSPFAPHPAGGECKYFSDIQRTFWLSECFELNQTKVPTYWRLHRHWFFYFQGHILHSTHIFICFSRKTRGIQHLLHRSHCFWSWKTTQKTFVLVLSVFWKLLSRFQSLCSIFPQFIKKFDVLTQFFQACHFLGILI